ncbi:hypothetical protein LCGC14_2485420, partial [marine sediment metagenome]
MAEREVGELIDLDITEVSLVKKPANRRRFLLTKEEDGTSELEIIDDYGYNLEQQVIADVMADFGISEIEKEGEVMSLETQLPGTVSYIELCTLCSGQGSQEPRIKCHRCNGTSNGAVGAGEPVACKTCNGYGYLERPGQCPECKGIGIKFSKPIAKNDKGLMQFITAKGVSLEKSEHLDPLTAQV